jgi:general nucleoside transport system permease protein
MIHLLVSSDIWFRTLEASTTLLFVALGGYLALRSGVLLLGLEGQLLLGCLAAVVCGEKSRNVWLGILGGVGGALLAGLAVMVLVVVLRANDVVVGFAVNIAAAGIAGTVLQGMYGHRGAISSPWLRPLPVLHVPGLEQVPWLGDVLSGQPILTYVGWAALALAVWWLASTVGGMTVRVAGLRAEMLTHTGRSITRARCLTMVVGSVCIGLGAAQLALGETVGFNENMTRGRGFIALVLVFLAGRRLWLVLPLTVCFAWFDAVGLGVQTVGLPSELSGVIPYVAVFVFMLVQRAPGRRGKGRASLLGGVAGGPGLARTGGRPPEGPPPGERPPVADQMS